LASVDRQAMTIAAITAKTGIAAVGMVAIPSTGTVITGKYAGCSRNKAATLAALFFERLYFEPLLF